MPHSQTFGRRPPPAPVSLPAIPKVRMAGAQPVQSAGFSQPAPEHAIEPVEQELAAWKESRRIRKRSFREPWRSVSLVAGLGFLATGWMVPDSVATVTQIALGLLSAGSFFAGWRQRKTGESTQRT